VSLHSAAIDLSNALKTVNEAWDEIRAQWNDPVSHDLEADTLEPLRRQTTTVLQALDRLSPILMKALRDAS
jgi:hypothetical protein